MTVSLDPQARGSAAEPLRQNSRLKQFPDSPAVREQLRAACAAAALKLDRTRPLSIDEMDACARGLLGEQGQSERYVGWTMVTLASAYWREHVATIPPTRRLFLLPECAHPAGDPAANHLCQIAEYRALAGELGCHVLSVEDSTAILTLLASGGVDAIVGVAGLNLLEKAIDKILLAGIPCMAVPLGGDACRIGTVDGRAIEQMLRLEPTAQSPPPRTYLHLLRAASQMFVGETFERLIGRRHRRLVLNELAAADLDPLLATEAIALDFVAKGGKHSRPFITLAVYDALTGGAGTGAGGAEHLAALPDAVQRAAMSIEIFHKASLVHDDIEDDDAFRYGEATIHRRYGVPTAINVGDYLIGLGYRLVSRDAAVLGPDVVADVLDRLAEAHLRLAEGQGAELAWRDSRDKSLTPSDALKIYALKTSPAFEAALYCGARLAGPADEYVAPFRHYAQHLGVAFQILNDLKDWCGDGDNKLLAGGDLHGGRPTVLWALALESRLPALRGHLEGLTTLPDAAAALTQVRGLYHEAGIFEQAFALVEHHRRRAEAIAAEVHPAPLRELLKYLIDTVLEHSQVMSLHSAEEQVENANC